MSEATENPVSGSTAEAESWMSTGASEDDAQPIELIVPAALEMAPLVRLMCAQLAAEAGMGLDDLDDLRLVATEVFTSAVNDDRSRRVSITFELSPGSVSAMFFTVGPGEIELDDLAAQILRSGVDEFEISGGAVRFVKRSSDA